MPTNEAARCEKLRADVEALAAKLQNLQGRRKLSDPQALLLARRLSPLLWEYKSLKHSFDSTVKLQATHRAAVKEICAAYESFYTLLETADAGTQLAAFGALAPTLGPTLLRIRRQLRDASETKRSGRRSDQMVYAIGCEVAASFRTMELRPTTAPNGLFANVVNAVLLHLNERASVRNQRANTIIRKLKESGVEVRPEDLARDQTLPLPDNNFTWLRAFIDGVIPIR